MGGMHAAFGGQSRLAFKHKRLLCRHPARPHKQVAERRMRFVRSRVRQGYFEGRDQFDVKCAVTQVAQFDLAKLNVVFRADPYHRMGLQLVPGCIKANPVSVVGAAVMRLRVWRGVLGDGYRLWLLIPPHIKKTAIRITQRIVAPACYAGLAPAAPASAVGTQRHTVATI